MLMKLDKLMGALALLLTLISFGQCAFLGTSSSRPTTTTTPSQPPLQLPSRTNRRRMQRPQKQLFGINYSVLEENDKKEMEWMVRTTSKLLRGWSTRGTARPQPGVRRIHKLMRAWERRSTRQQSGSPYVIKLLLTHLQEQEKQLHQQQRASAAVEGSPQEKERLVTIHTYNILLQAWSQSNLPESADMCERLLKELTEIASKEGGQPHLAPNRASFNACLKALVRRRAPLERIRHLLHEMEAQVAAGNTAAMPSRRSYTFLLYALANHAPQPTLDHAAEAMQVLSHMKETATRSTCGEAHSNLTPSINAYVQVMSCVSKAGGTDMEENLDQLLEDALRSSQHNRGAPTTLLYNTYMAGWLKSHQRKTEALDRICSALERMETALLEHPVQSEAQPDQYTLNTILAAYKQFGSANSIDACLAVRNRLQERYNVTSDSVTFNTLLECWAKSGRPEAPHEAIRILNFMERSHRTKKRRMRPDSSTYRAVIDCFIRCGVTNAAERAEQILERMEQMHREHGGDAPSVHVYNAVINAWASSNSTLAPRNALKLLRKLEMGDTVNIPKPTIVSYNTALKAVGTGKGPHLRWAEMTLARLENGLGNSNATITPDSTSYLALIRSLAQSNRSARAQQAFHVVKRMINLYDTFGYEHLKPTTAIFNTVLSACCIPDGSKLSARKAVREAAFKTMIETSETMKDFVSPNEVTYCTLLRGCATLLGEADRRRAQAVRDTFQRACDAGHCSTFVLSQLRSATDEDSFTNLTGFGRSVQLEAAELKPEWSRNVNNMR